MATYTREILAGLERTHRPRLTVFGGPAGREIPGPRLLGRHFRWPRRLRRLGADVFFGPAGHLPLGGTGLPSVVTVHDLAIYVRPEWFPSRQPLATRLVVPRSIESADAVIAVSHNTAEDLKRLFGATTPLTVIHLGVGPAFRPLPAEAVEHVRRRHRLPDRFILFVSTIEPRKNLLTLVEAWERMPPARRPALVVAGGWGWRYEAIKERLDRVGSGLFLLGAVDPEDLPALYNLATCLAHPALYEGFGLTPLEAMACGTPVVCSDAASLPEVVGPAALVVNPADVEGWTAALLRVTGDHGEARRLGKAGVLRASEFTWGRAAERTYAVLESVSSGPPAATAPPPRRSAPS